MELHYIILAHRAPKQVFRLIKSLDSASSRFYVHIDKNTSIDKFKRNIDLPNVYFLEKNKRYSGMWGDIGIVLATLQAFKEIKTTTQDSFCIILSGQDYPLHSSKYIVDFFAKNRNNIFIDVFPIPNPEWAECGLNRLQKYKFNWGTGRGDYFLLPSIYDKDFYKIGNIGKIKFLIKRGEFKTLFNIFRTRDFPRNLKPFGGSQWFALPIKVVKQIIVFLEEHPDYLAFHKYTLLPDEIFFHSIIMAINNKLNLKIKPGLTYTNWTDKRISIPATFTSGNLEELKKAADTKLFARKFDLNLDSTVLNEIDQIIKK
ncbi:beta-1,6-N-acetylglucosaminyltransferase [Gramella sp. GC03-9]|uniref:Peptide O-xylosyltransferase n=1 Tax=Christiangramia oceanisediminis TaxID=2920386 RepID=A0A9X2KV52_9FLAO|nr:beta-1,6-N-acetylglucosaminyltransferase [Gramella oceanisediminis]MCP9198315.1 beta-1,6-N-acetylglucosaminyltransferase [Gramella oceanisediminis]